MIEHFIESPPETVLKYRLSKELKNAGSVRLSPYPGLTKQWEAFLEREITELYSRWLSQIGVEARIILKGG